MNILDDIALALMLISAMGISLLVFIPLVLIADFITKKLRR